MEVEQAQEQEEEQKQEQRMPQWHATPPQESEKKNARRCDAASQAVLLLWAIVGAAQRTYVWDVEEPAVERGS
eukprot:CAMPEP_0198114840 /NCGR_PEP_ID=MMETSP1442-20131203/6105_1 /TAXON_ID= /ORGANISM="Craspedostauros australis, Strain CCMP3328" /LENGTH=72 /DNA_ID=CAMNT_0043772239 /DNA_START=173 /DNA_END=389 /DNA_ORIENTATION=-